MMTLKQVQAVYWVYVLGSYHAAADRLNTTQSAVSKRVLELESALNVKIFEPLNRTKLTIKGKEILGDLEKMLELHRNILLRVSDEEMYTGFFRVGVTEMVALTWLPALVTAVKGVFPRLALEPSVNLTSVLWNQIRNQRLDMIICPLMGSEEPEFQSSILGTMPSHWMCKPGLLPPVKDGERYNLQIMREQALLTYSEGSQLHLDLVHSLKKEKGEFKKVIHCNSMIALAELAAAGLGVTCLPGDYFEKYIQQGILQNIPCSILPPTLEYRSIHRGNIVSERISQIAHDVCNFKHPRGLF